MFFCRTLPLWFLLLNWVQLSDHMLCSYIDASAGPCSAGPLRRRNSCWNKRLPIRKVHNPVIRRAAGMSRGGRSPSLTVAPAVHLEILARRSEVSWARVDDYDNSLESWVCLYPPRVIQDTSCATLANALDQDMKLDGLCDNGVLGESSSILVMDDLADGHKTNIGFSSRNENVMLIRHMFFIMNTTSAAPTYFTTP